MAEDDVQGVVTDSNGDPVEGATVYALRTDSDPPTVAGEDTTNASGEFLISTSFNGKVHVTAQWESGGVRYSSDSSPFINVESKLLESTVFIGSGNSKMNAINASDGTLNWEYNSGGGVYSSAAYDGDSIYFGDNNATIYSVNASDGTEQWTYSASSNISGGVLVLDGTVYASSSASDDLFALNASDGTEKWVFNTAGGRSSLSIYNGVVYVGSNEGDLYAVNASDGSQKWSYTTPSAGQVQSSPAVVDGVVYCEGDAEVFALNESDGTEVWVNSTTGLGAYRASVAVYDGVVYVPTGNTEFYALNASDGTEKWVYTVGDSVFSSPTVSNGLVYFGAEDNTIYALNTSDGTVNWSSGLGSRCRTGAAAFSGRVYVGNYNGEMVAFDELDGTELWRYNMGDNAIYTSAIGGGDGWSHSNRPGRANNSEPLTQY